MPMQATFRDFSGQDTAGQPPLWRHSILDTRQPDEAREVIGKIFCPHFLNPAERRPERFHARHNSVRQAGYSVNFVAYGATVEIDPGELSNFFLLQVPLAGEAVVRCGTEVAEIAPGRRASVLSPTLATRMTWRKGCEKLIVLIKRDVVERQWAAMTHRPMAPVEFSTALDLSGPIGPSILGHVDLLLSAADNPTAMAEAYQVSLRDSLVTLMLSGQLHNQSGLLAETAAMPAPAAVRRAEEFIAAHADRALSVSDIAEAAGTCLRSLQDAFKRARGVTLTEAVTNRRLENLRAALLDPDAPRSVADLALSAGLGHLGRAAQAYKARFGETPSETLRRRR